MPPVDESGRRRHGAGIANWRTGLDPLLDGLLFLFGQASLVGKLANRRGSVPRGHASLLDDFVNHRRPTRDFMGIGHGERTNRTSSMAFNAMLIENLGHAVFQCDSRGSGLLDASNETSDCIGLRRLNLSTRQQIVDRGLQVVLRRSGLHVANSKLVIDSAVISHCVLAVEQKDFGRSSGPEEVGEPVGLVLG